MKTFSDFNLHADLMKGLDKMGFSTPTPIQARFIPVALQGKDVLASAQTGSGKTAAFLLPVFQQLLENPVALTKGRKHYGPRALVLTPTRELADQVMKVAKDLRAFTDLSVQMVTGGMPIMKQIRMLRQPVDVLVATPGRLIDLMMQNALTLKDTEMFVLDEADRMLDMGFSKDVLKISRAVGKPRQTMLLSATLEGRVEDVIEEVMTDPESIELTHSKQRHDNITQKIYRASDMGHKHRLLEELVKDNTIWQAVIFCGTKSHTEKLAEKIKALGEKVDYLHGDMRQSSRNISIKRMQKGHIRFLVATDVAARGLDIKDLTHVINFDLPQNSEDYTHRIGRVGRGGKTGEAISLVSDEQWRLMAAIEKMMGTSVEQCMMEGLEYTPRKKSAGGKKKSVRKAGPGRSGAGKSFDRKPRAKTTDKPRRESKFGDSKPRGDREGFSSRKPRGDKKDSPFAGRKPRASEGDKPRVSGFGKSRFADGDKPKGSGFGKPRGAKSAGKPARAAGGRPANKPAGKPMGKKKSTTARKSPRVKSIVGKIAR